MSYFVYILKCADASFYVGYTKKINQRLRTHNERNGAIYTAKRRPVKLVYFEELEDQKSAIQREQQIKNWSKAKKYALIENNLPQLKILAKKYKNKVLVE